MKKKMVSSGVKRPAKRAATEECSYRALFENAGDAIFIADANGRYVDVNPRGAELIGYSRQEVLGLSMVDILLPKERARLPQLFERILKGEPQISEWEILRKDGSTFPGEVNASLLPDGRAMGILRDISRRKRTDEELFKSRQMLQLVLDTIPQRVFWKDRNGKYLGCNLSLARDDGHEDPGEIVGKNEYQLSPKPLADLYTKDDRQVIETGIPKLGYEEPLIKPDGTRLWLRTSKVPLHDKDGSIIGVLGTYEDITRQKEVEQLLEAARDGLERRVEERTAELKASEERFRALVRFLPIGVTVICDARIAYANCAAVEIFGARNAAELIGMDVFKGVPKDRHSALRKNLDLIAKGKGLAAPHDGAIQRLDGKRVDIEVTAAPFLHEGRPASLHVFRDITERKLAGQQIKETTAALEQRTAELRALAFELTLAEQRERRRLAEVLHDDLQQLLASIHLHLIPLHANPESSAAAREVRNLTDQALKCSRSLTGDLCPPVLLESGLVPALEWLCGWTKEKHGLSVALKVGRATGCPISKDITLLLFRFLKELLFNVTKHAKVRTASVEVESKGDRLCIVVSDKGAGFDSKTVLSRTADPAGFGLFNIRERLELLGGNIEIFSAPGKGSRFTMWVPAKTKSAGEPAGRPGAATPKRRKSR